MRFGLLQEGDTPKGMTHYHRYHEVIKEVQVAEEVGFDFWGTSEQHFLPTVAPISAPETLYAAVAMKTSRIKLRHMSVLMLQFNHPIRIAERLATLDILSNGRVELSTARSNSHLTLNPFQVDATQTRDQWRETLEVVVKALTQAPFEHEGKMYSIPPTTVSPRMYRDSLFPVSVIASSPETFELAGRSGLGVITNDSYLGWEWLQNGADIYKKAIADDPQPFAPYAVNNSLGFSTFTSNCDTNTERALGAASHIAKGFFQLCYEIYTGVTGMSDSYAAGIGQIAKMADRRDDLDYMMQHTPTVMIGTPDYFIENIKRLESLGYDEVILRIDGFGHEQNKRAIELIGKYVIPEFKAPHTPVSPSEYEELGIADVPTYLI